MPAPALIFALALMAADTPAVTDPPQGEPLPAGAPTQDYPLTAWCYGAMSEYLDVYERVKPDLKAIDKMFGSSQPKEAEPYGSDMAAAHVELKVLADAVTAAEKASPSPIGPLGAQAIKQGRSVWALAEAKTSRELARAWLSWALPDRCDTTARSLTEKSALLGQALKYNTPPPAASDAAPPSTSETAPPPASLPPATAPVPAAPSAESEPPAPASGSSPAAPDNQVSPETAPTSPASPPENNKPDPNGPVPDSPPKT